MRDAKSDGSLLGANSLCIKIRGKVGTEIPAAGLRPQESRFGVAEWKSEKHLCALRPLRPVELAASAAASDGCLAMGGSTPPDDFN